MSNSFWEPMDCSLPGLSVHGILQAKILQWIAISFSRGSSWPTDRTLDRRILYHWATREATHLLAWLTNGMWRNEWIGKNPDDPSVFIWAHAVYRAVKSECQGRTSVWESYLLKSVTLPVDHQRISFLTCICPHRPRDTMLTCHTSSLGSPGPVPWPLSSSVSTSLMSMTSPWTSLHPKK